jgi:hypothetical protein
LVNAGVLDCGVAVAHDHRRTKSTFCGQSEALDTELSVVIRWRPSKRFVTGLAARSSATRS